MEGEGVGHVVTGEKGMASGKTQGQECTWCAQRTKKMPVCLRQSEQGREEVRGQSLTATEGLWLLLWGATGRFWQSQMQFDFHFKKIILGLPWWRSG